MSKDPRPKVLGNVRAFVSSDGTSIQLEMATEDGLIGFTIDADLASLAVTKLLGGVAEAEKRRVAIDPTAGRPGDMAFTTAMSVTQWNVGTFVGNESVGLRIHVSGAPFAWALTCEQARQISEALASAEKDVAAGRRPKAN